MSGLVVRCSDDPIPDSPVEQCLFNARRGVFLYHRTAKPPRKLRAVGASRWSALADHQSRLYRFEWSGLSHRYQADLAIPPDATTAYCRIAPEGIPREVFSALYSPASVGLVQFFWNVGDPMRWVTEGLGVYYGIGSEGELWSVVFAGVKIVRGRDASL